MQKIPLAQDLGISQFELSSNLRHHPVSHDTKTCLCSFLALKKKNRRPVFEKNRRPDFVAFSELSEKIADLEVE